MMQQHVLRVGDWPNDEDNPTFPVGSQPKVLLVCPDELMSAEVIPRHRYLLKTPAGRHRYQIWSEFIAAHLAKLAGVEAPPCWIAEDGAGTPGVLVEFFYGHPSAPDLVRFVHGADLLTRFIRDKKRGRPHGIASNVRLVRRYGVAGASACWGRMVAFDALIGNTDRHPENWGIVWSNPVGRLPVTRLAPAYDNASSLGWEMPDERLAEFRDAARLARYLAAGRHHCGWSPGSDARMQHVDLCARYLAAFPEAGEAMRSVIRFDEREFARILEASVQLGGRLPLSEARARFIADQVHERRTRLRAAIGV